jgi:preprotein translocase subunit SecY
MKLVENSHDWSKWWSIRLSIVGGALLTLLEVYPNVVATVIQTLPDAITDQIGTDILKTIGIVCIIASPIARVIKQSRLDKPSEATDHEA